MEEKEEKSYVSYAEKAMSEAHEIEIQNIEKSMEDEILKVFENENSDKDLWDPVARKQCLRQWMKEEDKEEQNE